MRTLLAAVFIVTACAPGEAAVARRCLSGPHELGRVRRLPITPMTTAKPRNPHEDALPHCPPDFADDLRDANG